MSPLWGALSLLFIVNIASAYLMTFLCEFYKVEILCLKPLLSYLITMATFQRCILVVEIVSFTATLQMSTLNRRQVLSPFLRLEREETFPQFGAKFEASFN